MPGSAALAATKWPFSRATSSAAACWSRYRRAQAVNAASSAPPDRSFAIPVMN